MRLTNYTPVQTEKLREIIRFSCPSGVHGFDIAFKNSNRGFCGRAYPQGCGYHARSMHRQGKTAHHRYYVVINIPRFTRYTKPNVSDHGGGYLRSVQFTHEEDVVHLVAHELRHLWQRNVPRGRRVWGARGQYSERDADAYAIRMVRAWRRLSAPLAKPH